MPECRDLQPETQFRKKEIDSYCVTNMQPVPPLQVLKVLHHTHRNTKQKPVWNDLNPKVLTADEPVGFIHHATQE